MLPIQKEWWRNTFDQKYLDTYIDLITPQRTKREVDFLIALFKKYHIQSVLDVACGYGRHSIPLAEAGFSVTGIDQSEYFIEKARVESSKPTFLAGDVRDFNVSEKFDAAINIFTSFGYFEDDTENQKVLANINSALKDNGIFVLDLPNPNNFKKTRKSTQILSNGISLITEEQRDEKAVSMKRTWGAKSYTAYFRLFGLQEITDMLERTGFQVVETKGSFDDSPLDEEKSPRYILVSKNSRC